MSTEKTEKGVRVDPLSVDPARILAGRTLSRRQALGLAGGAIAGVAALASMPRAATAKEMPKSGVRERIRRTTSRS